MTMFGLKRIPSSVSSLCDGWRAIPLVAALLAPSLLPAQTQNDNQQSLAQQIQQLTDAMAKVQAQLQQSQSQLDEMRKELSELQIKMAESQGTAPAPSSSTAGPSVASSAKRTGSKGAAIQDLEEHQAVLDSEIATQDQTKVESESKYPVKITGMVLLNGFVNSSGVDVAANPALAVGGSGSAGASVRQTMLGLDARGPHLFGAHSFADLRMDFFGSSAASTSTSNYSGYFNANTGLLRLRTAHAGLRWDQAEVYFALDRPIINGESPTSLTAVALPP